MTSCKISNKLSKIRDVARSVMENSNMQIRLGACVIRNGKICATGYNNTHRTCVSGYTFPAMHAEISAVSSFLCQTRRGISYRLDRLKSRGNSLQLKLCKGDKD